MPVTVMPAEAGPEPAEGVGVGVDDGGGVAAFLEAARERGADAAAAHDHDVHARRRYTAPGRARATDTCCAGLASTPVGIIDVAKRALVGRKLRSTQLGETLLPKRIALPVFASDALSSVAYAPDEIFLTLSLGGLTGVHVQLEDRHRRRLRHGRSWSRPTGRTCTPTRAAAATTRSRRSTSGRNAGLTVGSALLVDYVLTVAVSVSSGVQNAAVGAALARRPRGHGRDRCWCSS